MTPSTGLTAMLANQKSASFFWLLNPPNNLSPPFGKQQRTSFSVPIVRNSEQ